MRWKALAIVPLIFLGGGAAPPSPCMQPSSNGQKLSAPLDLNGRPFETTGITGPTFTETPSSESQRECQEGLHLPLRSDTLRSEGGDALHGLPSSDALQRLDEPRQAPMFQ